MSGILCWFWHSATNYGPRGIFHLLSRRASWSNLAAGCSKRQEIPHGNHQGVWTKYQHSVSGRGLSQIRSNSRNQRKETSTGTISWFQLLWKVVAIMMLLGSLEISALFRAKPSGASWLSLGSQYTRLREARLKDCAVRGYQAQVRTLPQLWRWLLSTLVCCGSADPFDLLERDFKVLDRWLCLVCWKAAWYWQALAARSIVHSNARSLVPFVRLLFDLYALASWSALWPIGVLVPLFPRLVFFPVEPRSSLPILVRLLSDFLLDISRLGLLPLMRQNFSKSTFNLRSVFVPTNSKIIATCYVKCMYLQFQTQSMRYTSRKSTQHIVLAHVKFNLSFNFWHARLGFCTFESLP